MLTKKEQKNFKNSRVIDGKKICRTCFVNKEVTDFPSNGYSKNGTKIYKPACKYCNNLKKRNNAILKNEDYYTVFNLRKEWAKKNKDKIQEYNKKYYKNLTKEEKDEYLIRIKKNTKIRRIKELSEIAINKRKGIH